ncbi:roadblock/LC7 domain-containing protein [Flexistipes sinusarabici]|uniref:Dynein regulation protein LC7 n=1 Tax=Flexistipes sinusarabici TaxID=2352 RepID=A0A3D5QA12_FLESI|nr:roadblock/LC7 domain-containing protein [Flexistipes sinusarabici]HCW92500.1 dynein regulation protein LC7 [Flexistipes sinusarabici]
MSDSSWIYDEKIIKRLEKEVELLKNESGATAAFLVDKNGQPVATSTSVSEYDTTSIAALVAGNVAATDGLAKLLGEKEFSLLFHEGENEHVHISLIFNVIILVVIFDESTSLGLIRLRVKKFITKIEEFLKSSFQDTDNDPKNIFGDITDDEIEGLFDPKESEQ